ncbi:hypothetical protein PWT90_00493 [Aphanocladium album]|nr:hypothetical protein PWT90_00493 [Aphanocladium album]
MKFNLVAATLFVGAVSAVTLKERVAAMKERAAAGAAAEGAETNAARLRNCRESFGSCENCYDRFPYCHSDQLPSQITCTHHVKCDESRPVCKKCAIKGRECHYALESQLPAGRSTMGIQIDPPNRDFMQAAAYSRIGKSSGRLLQFGDNPASAALWVTYNKYMAKHLKIINSMISVGYNGKKTAFYPLFLLLSFDLAVHGSMWQTHTKGIFAYIEHIGGIKAILNMQERPWKFPFFLDTAIKHGTTTPATRQLHGYDYYSDDEIKSALVYPGEKPLSCPVDLVVAIVHITRLRARIAASRTLPDGNSNFNTAASQVFKAIDGFRARDWENTPNLDGGKPTPNFGSIFQVAVRLYGILTLPARAVLAAYPQGCTYRIIRAEQRQKLVDMLEKTLPAMQYPIQLDWPLLVAGVAAGAADEDPKALRHQEFVRIWFQEIVAWPLSDTGSFLCLQKLAEFWNSGKTGWEECFYEPTPF